MLLPSILVGEASNRGSKVQRSPHQINDKILKIKNRAIYPIGGVGRFCMAGGNFLIK